MDDSFKELADVSKHVLGDLEKFVGKSLAWVAVDEATQEFYLVFNDLTVLSVGEASAVSDGPAWANRYLKENLKKAEMTLALKNIVEKNTTQIPLELPALRKAALEFGPEFAKGLDQGLRDGIAAVPQPPMPPFHEPLIEATKGESDAPRANEGAAKEYPGS